MRSLLYLIAKLLGDVNAIRNGRVKQRVKRRITGRLAGKLLRKL